MLKIVHTDDHDIFRDGMKLLLTQLFPEAELLEADSLEQLEAVLAEHQDVSLVLLDIRIPGVEGLAGLKHIKQSYPILPVIVMSTVDQAASIQQMVTLGADGFISKDLDKASIVSALKRAITGERVFVSPHHAEPFLQLSPRKIELIKLLEQGLSNKEIADQIRLSSSTVRDYVSELLTLFECDNRTQLVTKVRKLGYIID